LVLAYKVARRFIILLCVSLAPLLFLTAPLFPCASTLWHVGTHTVLVSRTGEVKRFDGVNVKDLEQEIVKLLELPASGN
jgi:hypothetical protein